ncbi:hypothetical protein HZH68_007393 [Vespula germanica]|uniref:Uncharacterized protein n=1 Tax=Vespula germanica TaxID=30212 RepID=A0A834K7G1_VESGE|nr:hypothetical protein HZH68_007393 [Vespula germanica]
MTDLPLSEDEEVGLEEEEEVEEEKGTGKRVFSEIMLEDSEWGAKMSRHLLPPWRVLELLILSKVLNHIWESSSSSSSNSSSREDETEEGFEEDRDYYRQPYQMFEHRPDSPLTLTRVQLLRDAAKVSSYHRPLPYHPRHLPRSEYSRLTILHDEMGRTNCVTEMHLDVRTRRFSLGALSQPLCDAAARYFERLTKNAESADFTSSGARMM